ncbi:S-layer homology domain-containing protein [Paenibacillus sp. UASWS1643]|uniref:S-layer homology domain-containing protein n=1 Tax=Paenibacillus sp. UASWS1643 TaxID=2580422 RepID=UPI001683A900|nr:S-layer homology domain-containing protein [Paenibacillus sp. UASWS1643]
MKKKVIVMSTIIALLAATVQVHAEPTVSLDNSLNSKQMNPNTDRDAGQKISFKDIQGHWAISSIQAALDKGIVSGYPNGMFYPENKVTRAEFLKLIVSSLGHEAEPTKSNAKWYDAYVTSAKVNNLYVESDFSSSDWSKPMTRMEMVHVAARAIGQIGTDDYDFLYLAVKNGLLSGTGNGKLDPEGTTTRAQALTVVDRIGKVRSGQTLKVDTVALKNAEKAKNAERDPWGRVIRTTNLPKNAKDFPYILEDYPNEMYEMKPNIIVDTTSAQLAKSDEYFNNKGMMDQWKQTTENYYNLMLNVDYRTIDEEWANELFSYHNQGFRVVLADMRRYVKWVKENKIIIKGSLVAEPSMLTDADRLAGYFIRTKFSFEMKSYAKYENIMFDERFMKVGPFKKGKRYEGYSDIPLSTNSNTDDLKVSGDATLFSRNSIVREVK